VTEDDKKREKMSETTGWRGKEEKVRRRSHEETSKTGKLKESRKY
jgi:hypothetical protein